MKLEDQLWTPGCIWLWTNEFDYAVINEKVLIRLSGKGGYTLKDSVEATAEFKDTTETRYPSHFTLVAFGSSTLGNWEDTGRPLKHGGVITVPTDYFSKPPSTHLESLFKKIVDRLRSQLRAERN